MSVFNDNSSDLHIWDNAAFDCGDSLDATAAIRNSWTTVGAFESANKENHNVNQLSSPTSVSVHSPLQLSKCVKDLADSKKNELGLEEIDNEIEDAEKEIHRLSCRLLELKNERNARNVERRGRVAFLEQNKNAERLKKLEDSLTFPSAGSVSHERKGLIVGQSEIISAGAMTRRMIKKMDESPTPLNQNRKSCFWKLDQIDELKMTKERGRGGGGGGKRFSLSPRSTKAILKLPKQAATTIVSKRASSKMDEKVTSTVLQPKKLFEEPVKKTAVKAGRIVASKYNTGLRKRSLPENDESKGNDKKRASLEVNASSKQVEQQGSRVKKKWEIPTKVVVFNSCTDAEDDDQTPENLHVLPRIRTARFNDETPRDSGAVKRAADNKSSSTVFCEDNEQVCHSLTFGDE